MVYGGLRKIPDKTFAAMDLASGGHGLKLIKKKLG
jgi:hypothetical protein